MAGPGFHRYELRTRYDVPSIHEDEWHTYSGERTAALVADHLAKCRASRRWLLNAGAGVYQLAATAWTEIPVDLFLSPLLGRKDAICGNIERLPFASRSFGAVVCVGEVLAYCDPAAAISEFARVLAPNGMLICDFGNSRSARHWFRRPYGRAADLIVDEYNGGPERTWVYNPAYISALMTRSGLSVQMMRGIHAWSAVARRIGLNAHTAMAIQRCLEWLPLPTRYADLTTIVGARDASEK